MNEFEVMRVDVVVATDIFNQIDKAINISRTVFDTVICLQGVPMCLLMDVYVRSKEKICKTKRIGLYNFLLTDVLGGAHIEETSFVECEIKMSCTHSI